MRSALIFTVLLMLAPVTPVQSADAPAIRLSFDGTHTAVLTHLAEQWKLQGEGAALSLTTTADGALMSVATEKRAPGDRPRTSDSTSAIVG